MEQALVLIACLDPLKTVKANKTTERVGIPMMCTLPCSISNVASAADLSSKRA